MKQMIEQKQEKENKIKAKIGNRTRRTYVEQQIE